MKFLVTWEIHEGKLHEALALFSGLSEEDERAMMGDGIKMVGRWHDLVRGTGAAVFEAASATDISQFLLHWNAVMNFDIVPVLDDKEAKAVGQSMASG